MLKYTRFGLNEMARRWWIPAEVKLLQRFVPELKASDVIRYL